MEHAAPRRQRRGLVVALAAALVVGTGAGAYAWSQRDGDVAPSAAPSEPPEPAVAEPTTWGPTAAEKKAAEKKAAALSLEELAGQLIVARHFSDEQSLSLVRDQHFAGVMVTGNRILDVGTTDPLKDVEAFNARLHDLGAKRGVPVMIPIDQEGGLVARLGAPMTPFPTFMSAGAAIAGDPENGARAVTDAARASGAELRAAGFNTVFAPDGDVTVGIADPIIGSRSAGSDPEVVARAVTSAVTGYSEAGILSSVKHFPGHNVDEDSHKGLPRLTSDRDRLKTNDLPPFVAAIDAGVPSIMTGHLDVRAIEKGVPASMSAKVITTGLRENLSYDGLVISDSLGMGAVMDRYPDGEAAVQAIKAGSDLALMPANNTAAYDAMLAALKSGDLPEQQARDSAARTIAWLTHAEASPRLPGDPGSHVAESRALSAAAVTVVSRPCDAAAAKSFRPMGSPELVKAFTDAAQDAGVAIGSGPSVVLVGYSTRGVRGDVVVTTDRPYALAVSSAPTKIALYGTGKPAMSALIAVLTDTSGAKGRLPVSGLEQQAPC